MLGEVLRTGRATHQRRQFVDETLRRFGERTPPDSAYLENDSGQIHLAQALAEAWDWLVSSGLLAESVSGMLGGRLPVEGWLFVTRFGRRVAATPRARNVIVAERRLGMDLHPRLEERARRQFVLGEFPGFDTRRTVELGSSPRPLLLRCAKSKSVSVRWPVWGRRLSAQT